MFQRLRPLCFAVQPAATPRNRLAILPNHAQTLSLFGDTLFGPAEASESALANLAEAEATYLGNPDDADAHYGLCISLTAQLMSGFA